MTGFMDAYDQISDTDKANIWSMTSNWRYAANHEAVRYASEMRVPAPLLVTAIKPSGTLSLLPTVSCGMHRGYATYFIRRISISAMDPISDALKEIGVPYEEDITQKSCADVAVRRLKFVFPVKTKTITALNEEPAKDQLQRYLNFQKYYTDHNTSSTITIGWEEWGQVTDMVCENWDDIVACAFLGKMEDSHPQLPYQRITEEEYLRLSEGFPDLSTLSAVLERIEFV
jgi:ribonucleoside-diphosphate reductase alpha chain/ribonucleoside-triphosphate reductase